MITVVAHTTSVYTIHHVIDQEVDTTVQSIFDVLLFVVLLVFATVIGAATQSAYDLAILGVTVTAIETEAEVQYEQGLITHEVTVLDTEQAVLQHAKGRRWIVV